MYSVTLHGRCKLVVIGMKIGNKQYTVEDIKAKATGIPDIIKEVVLANNGWLNIDSLPKLILEKVEDVYYVGIEQIFSPCLNDITIVIRMYDSDHLLLHTVRITGRIE